MSSAPLFVTNAPSADTYSEAYGSEKKNFGAEPVLRLDQWGGRQVFLRFPLENVPGGRRVLNAKLRLYITDIGFNEQGEFPELKTCVALYDVVTPWTESGLTHNSPDGVKAWNQGPGIPGARYADVGPLPKADIGVRLRQTAIPLDPLSITNHSWLEVDVASFLRDTLQRGSNEINLVLRSSTLGRNYTFASWETVNVEQRPQLILELDEHLPEFRLEAPLLTNWKPGETVAISLCASKGRPIPGGKSWSFEKKPVTSALSNSAFKERPGGVAFQPDVPGCYRVAVSVEQPASGSGTAHRLATTEAADVFVLSVPAHPRLYVTPESLAGMRAGVKSRARLTQGFLQWVKAGSAGVEQGKFHDSGLNEGCENTALAWLLTSDRQYLSNSIAYARRILQKPMREHFADVHAATFLGAAWVHAMAVHYDWCYDQLPEEHRRAVADWLKEAASWAWIRSGAPIAHNDGGARQCLLASAALALLRDDPAAEEMFRRSSANFSKNLLPWLNDGGRGGRSGDGGEYEGLHAFYIVRYAWMSQTATGADVFSESPFFFNRLNHLLFGWYPRRLVDRSGSLLMRQYYSPSGDHIRMGFVGDTQPYQSAAALCARYRDTPEGQAVRFLAGQWPTQWMQYTLRWAVLGDFENVPVREPKDVAFLDPGCNTVFIRSDWSDDATWILFENAPYVSAHGSLDSGTFEIFKGDVLAARTGNLDYANVGAKHVMNYLHRTIAGNCLLIDDPAEKWKGFLGGAEGGRDGGGERTNFPLSSSPDAETFLNYREIFERGQITAFRKQPGYVYAAADLTPAYNNARIHGGRLNRPKVNSVTRELLYLRELDSLIVFDRVSSIRPEFRKTWLLHSLGELEVLDGKESKIDEGEFHYTGATQAVIRYGWPKPVPSFGRCLSVTLLPENANLRKIGGRVELPEGKTESFAGDQWHGQHQHHHIKDFWVCGTNYPPGNPPETRWFGEPGDSNYVPGTPDESGGRGKWRIEVSPAAPATNDIFFHVLCPRLGQQGLFPDVNRANAPEGYTAAVLSEAGRVAIVFFSREKNRHDRFESILPEGAATCYITGMRPGRYEIETARKPTITMNAHENGLLCIEATDHSVLVRPAQ